jgi:hypothetical protein
MMLIFFLLVSRCFGIISKSYIVKVDDRNSLSGTAACYGRIISNHFQKDCQEVSHSSLESQASDTYYFWGEFSSSSFFWWYWSLNSGLRGPHTSSLGIIFSSKKSQVANVLIS